MGFRGFGTPTTPSINPHIQEAAEVRARGNGLHEHTSNIPSSVTPFSQAAGSPSAAAPTPQQQPSPHSLWSAAAQSQSHPPQYYSSSRRAPVTQQPDAAAPAATTTPSRPPLPPPVLLTSATSAGSSALMTPAASHELPLHVTPSGPRDLAPCLSACSSLGTCSSMGDLTEEPPTTTTATTATVVIPCSVSLAPGPSSSRRASLLSDASRSYSRRGSTHTDCSSGASSGSSSPQQLTPACSAEAAAAADWWACPWSFGAHSEQNGRCHMEDRISASDVSGRAVFARFKRAGFFAVFDGCVRSGASGGFRGCCCLFARLRLKLQAMFKKHRLISPPPPQLTTHNPTTHHRHSGSEAAEYLQEHLLNLLSDLTPDQLAAAPGAALGAAIERAESEILRTFSAAACNAGSTLLAALLLDDMLYIANVGDCRAVLVRGTDAVQITTDHKPKEEGEAARIARDHQAARAAPAAIADGSSGSSSSRGRRAAAAAGSAATATTVRGSSDGCGAGPPLITSDGYLYGELAVARALGSQHLKRDPTKRAFTHVPDIFGVRLARRDDMLLLASDGLWDKVDNSEAAATARRVLAREKDASTVARMLSDRAVRHNSTDNISVVVVCLHDRGVALPKTNSMLFRRLQLSDGGGGSRPVTPVGGGVLGGGGAAAGGDGVSAPPLR